MYTGEKIEFTLHSGEHLCGILQYTMYSTTQNATIYWVKNGISYTATIPMNLVAFYRVIRKSQKENG